MQRIQVRQLTSKYNGAAYYHHTHTEHAPVYACADCSTVFRKARSTRCLSFVFLQAILKSEVKHAAYILATMRVPQAVNEVPPRLSPVVSCFALQRVQNIEELPKLWEIAAAAIKTADIETRRTVYKPNTSEATNQTQSIGP
jgi:hypothetical protein